MHLGMTEDDAVFQPLLDSELCMKNMSKPAKLGDNRKEDPWFWYTGRPGSISLLDNSSGAERLRVKGVNSVQMSVVKYI